MCVCTLYKARHMRVGHRHVRTPIHLLTINITRTHTQTRTQGKTHESLQAMGDRLATEVVERLEIHNMTGHRRPLAALSFVGHSLGTLVVRAALATSQVRKI